MALRARTIDLFLAAACVAACLVVPANARAANAPVRAASATITDTGSADNPAVAYVGARKALAGPWQSFVGQASPVIDLSDLAGQTIEVSGRIVGRAVLPDDSLMLIIDVKGQSFNLASPANSAAYWLESGFTARVLVQVPDAAELARSKSMLPVVASAPDFAVAEIEKPAVVAKPAAPAKPVVPDRSAATARPAPATSRTASYEFRAGQPGSPIAPLSQTLLNVYSAYRSFIAGQNPRLSARQIDTITTSILYYSEQAKLDPRLVIAMILAESNFDPYSTSRTGAMGLSQLMPGTASGLGVNDAYDPVQNIGAAVHILSSHVRSYGGASDNGLVPINTLILTMAAYNAGSGAVRKYGGVPPYRETQHYVRKVAALYKAMCGL